MPEPNGWERWRGTTDARLEDIEAQVEGLWHWRNDHEREVGVIKQSIFERLTRLETKVAGFAALGAAAGTVVAVVIQWLLSR